MTASPRHPYVYRRIEQTIHSIRASGAREFTIPEFMAHYTEITPSFERQPAIRIANIMWRWSRRLGVRLVGKKLVPRSGWNTGYTSVWRVL